MKHIINQLILLAHQWNITGQSDKRLEQQFDLQLTKLEQLTGLNREGAIDLMLGGENNLS